MEIGHQLWQITVRIDQLIIHIKRVRGGVAQSFQPLNLGQFSQQSGKVPDFSVRCLTMIGIHILPEQRQLTRACRDKAACLGGDGANGPGEFRSSCVGNNTESAEFVTPFLYAKKRRRAPRRMFAGQKVELHLFGKFGIDNAGTCARINLGNQLRQSMIGLRAYNDINPGRSAGNFLTLCLRNTASNGNHHIAALLIARPFLHHPQTAQLGEHLFRCLLADVTGIENHHIRTLGAINCLIAQRRKRICHAVRVIDIHLTAIGFDEKFLAQGSGHAG